MVSYSLTEKHEQGEELTLSTSTASVGLERLAMLYSSTPERAKAVPAMLAPLAAVWKNTMDAAMTTCTTVLFLQAPVDAPLVPQLSERACIQQAASPPLVASS